MAFKILSKDVDAFGVDTYRDEDATIPLAFRPTITHSVNPNSAGTNNQVTVKVRVPVVTTVNGVIQSTNRFEFVGKFSALQNVTSDGARVRCLDAAIEYLNRTKAAIVNGQLPSAAVALSS